jgi:hypothetical protein
MTRYYLEKSGKKITQINIQDETGIYYGDKLDLVEDYKQMKATIWNEKTKQSEVVRKDSLEYFEYIRTFERGKFLESTATEIFEFAGTKEAALDFIRGYRIRHLFK